MCLGIYLSKLRWLIFLIHTFPKGISLKVNIIEWSVFELTSEVAVYHISCYATITSRNN